jgi:hypothetical protein
VPRSIQTSCIAVIVLLSGVLAAPALADEFPTDAGGRGWLEGGLGAAELTTRAAELPGRHGAAVLNIAAGYRVTPQLGVGLEFTSSAPLSSCNQWDCGGRSWDFKPGFNRFSAFGEMRFFQGRVRLRVGAGDASYCYAGDSTLDLWYTVFEPDGDVQVSSCSAVHRFVRSASVGYHWRMGDQSTPLTAGFRLGWEGANFHSKTSVGLPAFKYRAVTLTLQLSFN